MIKELKTLKEIKGLDKGCANLVRQEVINWIKNKRKKKEKIQTYGAKRYSQGYIHALIDFNDINDEEKQ